MDGKFSRINQHPKQIGCGAFNTVLTLIIVLTITINLRQNLQSDAAQLNHAYIGCGPQLFVAELDQIDPGLPVNLLDWLTRKILASDIAHSLYLFRVLFVKHTSLLRSGIIYFITTAVGDDNFKISTIRACRLVQAFDF